MEKGTGPDGKDLCPEEQVQHLSCLGEEREEILVFNHKALYIYTNAAVWQRPRFNNTTAYTGR